MLLGNQYNANIATAINQLIDAKLLQLDTVLPAKVVSVKGGLATVQVLTELQYDNEQAMRPQLEDIPVYQVSSSKAIISIPVAPDDLGLVIACQRDLDNFKSSHSTYTPSSNRTFSFIDAVFIPIDFKQNIQPTTENALCIQSEGVEIVLDGSTLKVNAKDGVNIESSSKIEIKATSDCKIDAVNCEVKASGNLDLDGTIVKIAGGGAGVARIGDAVATPAGAGTITGGSMKVLCG